jgi:nicotinamidase-related amidase
VKAGEVKRAALLVIDMQAGLFTPETPRYDAEGVVKRINGVARAVRLSGGVVVFIQHDGPPGDTFEPGAPGWELLPSLERRAEDPVVHKTACDSFYETDLELVLTQRRLRRLLIAGCATDFCVDTTVRAAMSHEYDVAVVADGHTTADRPHVDAASLIRHHNWLWRELIHPKVQVEVVGAADMIAGLEMAARARRAAQRGDDAEEPPGRAR